ncbi:BON domain-containing protein [Terriglobus aquaticus]|uniref:BON domain-containing protein n=1 Tax=Terriglobus aquaticus TaxID=940139 RepID=A0ABW9KH94_9BACT|nr:BON domain-containing protein [Terriglobus aquaticus]
MVQAVQHKFRGPSAIAGIALAATLLLPVGCKQSNPTVADPAVTSAVQSRLQGDSAISTEPIQVSTTSGTVTLTGQVSNAAARTLAANDAASVQGVQKVVNDITVAANTPPVSATAVTPQPMTQPEPSPTPRARVEPRREAPREAPIVRSAANNAPQPAYQPAPAPAPVQRAQQTAPAAPPPPAFRTVTVPAGSTLPVRITQTLDSDNAHAGDSFSGALATDLVEDGVVVLPRGSAVTGTVVDAKDAGHFKGQSRLSIQLTGISRRGQQIAISTDPVVKEGAARGKNTAIKTGIGAAGGAILGGIFGGGKGAAIGSVAGGGTGAAINGVTRGEQVSFPSETVVRFSTTNSFTVRVPNRDTSNGPGSDNGPVLNRQ